MIRFLATRNSHAPACSIGFISRYASTSSEKTSCKMSSMSRGSATRLRMKFRSRERCCSTASEICRSCSIISMASVVIYSRRRFRSANIVKTQRKIAGGTRAFQSAGSSAGFRTPRCKLRALLEMLGEMFLVGIERWANQAMKAELSHLLRRFTRGPTLDRHAIRGHHHSGSIVAVSAMNKDFFIRIFPQQRQKLGEDAIPGVQTVPGNGNKLHAGGRDIPLFCFLAAQT